MNEDQSVSPQNINPPSTQPSPPPAPVQPTTSSIYPSASTGPLASAGASAQTSPQSTSPPSTLPWNTNQAGNSKFGLISLGLSSAAVIGFTIFSLNIFSLAFGKSLTSTMIWSFVILAVAVGGIVTGLLSQKGRDRIDLQGLMGLIVGTVMGLLSLFICVYLVKAQVELNKLDDRYDSSSRFDD